MNVIICRSPYVRTAMHCTTCERVRPMAGVFGLYYGATVTCIGCGDTFTSGEGRHPRPFQRAWRPKAIALALEIWPLATPLRMEMERQMAAEDAALAKERAA